MSEQKISNQRNSYVRAMRGSLLGCLGIAGSFALASPVWAGATIPFGDGQSITIGMGVRGSLTEANHAAPDGGNDYNANLDSIRLYMGGKLNDHIGATFNTEYSDATGDIKVLDAYLQFNFNEHVNIWAGQLLPPSDRSNLDGPYYLSTYNYPGLVSRYPAKYAGRDVGATLWGSFLDKHLSYAVGVFRGHNRIFGASNDGSNPLFAGRVAYNFWEVEDNPGYYTSSTYYGSANILTLAFAGMYEKDGVGTALNPGNFSAWNVDALMEKKIGDGGAVTFEGAYYQYRTQGRFDVAPGFNGAGPTDNVGGIAAGDAYLASLGFLIPQKIGPGRLQPVVRFQEFDPKGLPGHDRQYDASLNYIIKGHNARISLDYARFTSSVGPDSHLVTLGAQLQF